MSTISYDNRKFRSVENTANGEVSGDTLFQYHQDGDIVWATYKGGSVHFGVLVAKVLDDDHLEVSYSHVNIHGEIQTGICHSFPEVLPDGRLRLYEHWQWTSGDESKGKSIVEELKQ